MGLEDAELVRQRIELGEELVQHVRHLQQGAPIHLAPGLVNPIAHLEHGRATCQCALAALACGMCAGRVRRPVLGGMARWAASDGRKEARQRLER